MVLLRIELNLVLAVEIDKSRIADRLNWVGREIQVDASKG